MSDQSTYSPGVEELVIGLVAPIGTDLDTVSVSLSKAFEAENYCAYQIRLSDLLPEVAADFSLDLNWSNPGQRYEKLMTAGNRFRRAMNRGDALAMLGVCAIEIMRKSQRCEKRVYVLRQLKHPAEIKALRAIYGPAFVLISVASSRPSRLKHIAGRLCSAAGRFSIDEAMPEADALINRDQEEQDDEMGQNVGKAFHLADFFVDADRGAPAAIRRLVRLLLGDAFITPSRSEQGMFLAQAAAVRSSSLQRQVGAIVATKNGSVVAMGTNEVPRAGGGLYWEDDSPDKRDFTLGGEINDEFKNRILVELISRLVKRGATIGQDATHPLFGVTDAKKISDWLLQDGCLKSTRLMSLLEFGRCVHAEMAALCDAAMRGVAVRDCIMFSTTFPCHECARHIVAAGIEEVVYVEPYPKSAVRELFPDSIALEDAETTRQVRFVPFVGVAPRRYYDMFRIGDADRKAILRDVRDGKSGLGGPRLGEYSFRTKLINADVEKVWISDFDAAVKEAKRRTQRGNGSL